MQLKRFQGDFAAKGPPFHGKRGLATPPPNAQILRPQPLAPPPLVLEEPPPGIFSKTPDCRTPPPLPAQSPHCEAPFTVKRRPLFGENAFFAQLKGARLLLQGPRFLLRRHRFSLRALRSPLQGPF